MSLLIEQDSEVERLHRGTRRFLFTALLLALAIIGTIVVRQGLFRQTSTLNFVTDSALDIAKGQPVKIAGFKVGAVDEVTLRPDGKVAVEVEVDEDSMRFITRDAQIELHKEGLVGSAVLEILPGPDRSRLAADGAELAFTRDDGLTTLANNLSDRILPILADVKTVTGTLADPQHGLSATLAQVQGVTRSLDELLRNGNQQVGAVGQATTRTVLQAETGLQQLNRTLSTVNQNLPDLIAKTQGIMDHMARLTGEAGATVPDILRDGKATAADVHDILTGVKTAWPVRDLVTPPGPAVVPSDTDPHGEAARAR